ncbi:hypothetical protein QVH35_11460 [Candidatus Nitrosotenuis chungbukensis]|uniref:hypothetical protein n=1 Tax=Candidatus Nitrosotenuis chungbukensis TaxID=1353246 RepID=UPI002673C154|nr:hypothetical protein [Candidatus Nitrosotenuis chungbukensis]WKT57888.1 hypothetical protein QVH35_11460 [Candidatus Nitrosotenuis chungbukensis]
MVALVILANTSLHSDAAVTYEKQENSKYVKDRIAEPLKGKSGWWKYILRVCADDHSLGITEVVLRLRHRDHLSGRKQGNSKRRL